MEMQKVILTFHIRVVRCAAVVGHILSTLLLRTDARRYMNHDKNQPTRIKVKMKLYAVIFFTRCIEWYFLF